MKKSKIIFLISLIAIFIILNFSGLGFATWQYWIIGGLVIVCYISGYNRAQEDGKEFREYLNKRKSL